MSRLHQTLMQQANNVNAPYPTDNPVSKGLRKWRERQRPGAIMKPATFKEIKRKASRAGARDPEAVAGAAYWTTARKKYRERRKRK